MNNQIPELIGEDQTPRLKEDIDLISRGVKEVEKELNDLRFF